MNPSDHQDQPRRAAGRALWELLRPPMRSPGRAGLDPQRTRRAVALRGVALIIVALVGLLAMLPAERSSSGVASSTGASVVTVGARGMEARIDAAASGALRSLRLAGFSVAVSQGGQLVFAKGYGFADLEGQVPARANTIYRTGSVGKQFTAATLVRLAEEGRLSLDDALGEYLIDYPPTLRTLTIRQLLSHTAGLLDVDEIPSFARSQGVGMALAELIELIGDQPLKFEPGTDWYYSNSGYILAGAIIEAVTGRPSAQLMIEDVLRPLGLRDTSTCGPQVPAERWARGYDPQDDGGWTRILRLGRPPTLVEPRPINLAIVSSAGGFCSTAIDLVRWADALHGGDLLGREWLKEMTEPTTLADGSKVPYGLGLQLRSFGDHRAIAHGGVIWGFNAALARFPDDDLSVALMINTLIADEAEAEAIWTAILSAIFNDAPDAWQELEVEDANGYRR